MSAHSDARALERLAAPRALLARERTGAYGVYPQGDRRRRPVARLSEQIVRDLMASGALAAGERGEGLELTEAGRAMVRRGGAAAGEEFIAQHGEVIARTIVADDGAMQRVRGFDPDAALRRLGAMRDAAGAAWLSDAELAAASGLRRDWDAAQIGMVRGADWSAPPRSANSRGPGNGMEGAMASQCDARRRLSEALGALAAPLRRVVERVCLHEQGLEAVERAEGWPPRSAKLALKLGLAQLAARRA